MYTKLLYLILVTFLVTLLITLHFSLQSEEMYVISLEQSTNKATEYDTEEAQKLYDIEKFRYVLNNKSICSADVTAVILVTSYFGNVECRSAMRRSYSGEELTNMKIRMVFMLGMAPSDKYTTQTSVENEAKRFGDIIQGNFIEAYRNLTYKHIMGLKWIQQYCTNTKFVIKMDDDIVVNIERIPQLLDTFNESATSNFIAGYVLRNMLVIREPANKWFVTYDEYSANTYPPFVSGWFYITNPYTCINLYNISQSTKYFWIDDTLITGILAQKLNIQHIDIKANFTVHSEIIECCIHDILSKNLNCDILVGPNGGNNNLFYDFNNALAICNLRLCKNRIVPIERDCIARKESFGKGNAIVESYKLS